VPNPYLAKIDKMCYKEDVFKKEVNSSLKIEKGSIFTMGI